MPPQNKKEMVRKALSKTDDRSLFGITTPQENPYGLSLDRTALSTLAIGAMLNDGYEIEDILYSASDEMAQKRLEYGKGVMDAHAEPETFGVIAVRNYVTVLEKLHPYTAGLLKNVKMTADYLKPENEHLANLCRICMDAAQELGRSEIKKTMRSMGPQSTSYINSLIAQAGPVTNYSNTHRRLLEIADKLYGNTPYDPNDLALQIVGFGIPYTGSLVRLNEKAAQDTGIAFDTMDGTMVMATAQATLAHVSPSSGKMALDEFYPVVKDMLEDEKKRDTLAAFLLTGENMDLVIPYDPVTQQYTFKKQDELSALFSRPELFSGQDFYEPDAPEEGQKAEENNEQKEAPSGAPEPEAAGGPGPEAGGAPGPEAAVDPVPRKTFASLDNEGLFSAIDGILDLEATWPDNFGIPRYEEKSEKNFGLSAERTALATVATGLLLAEGYTFDDIYDPEKLKDKRLEVGRKVNEMYLKGGMEFGYFAGAAYSEVLTRGEAYINEKLSKPDFSMDDLLNPGLRNFFRVAHVYVDAGQELPKLISHGVTPDNLQEWQRQIYVERGMKDRPLPYENLLKNIKRMNSDKGLGVDEIIVSCLSQGAIAAYDRALVRACGGDVSSLEASVRSNALLGDITQNLMGDHPQLRDELAAKLKNKDFQDRFIRSMLDLDKYAKIFDVRAEKIPDYDPDESVPNDSMSLKNGTSLTGLVTGFTNGTEHKPFDVSSASKEQLFEHVEKMTDLSCAGNAHYGITEAMLSGLDSSNVHFNITTERSGLAALAFGRLLIKGFRISDILNPDLLKDERAAAGKEAVEMIRGDKEAFGKYAAEGYHAVMQELVEYVERNVPAGMTTEQLLSDPALRDFPAIGYLLQDAGQEFERVKEYSLKLEEINENEAVYTEQRQKALAAANKVTQYRDVLTYAHQLYTGTVKGEPAERPSLTDNLLSKAMPAVKDLVLNGIEKPSFTDYAGFRVRNSRTVMNSMTFMSEDQRLRLLIENEAQAKNLALSMISSGGQKTLFPVAGRDTLDLDLENGVKPLDKQADEAGDEFIEKNTENIRRIISLEKTGNSFWGLSENPADRLPDLNVNGKTVLQDERTNVSSLVFSAMIEEGYDIDDILDPAKLQNERRMVREQVVSLYREAVENDRGEFFAQAAASTYAAGVRKCIEYINAKTANGLSVQDLFRPEMSNLMTVNFFMGDAAQLLDKRFNAYTGNISDCKKILEQELSIDSVMCHYRDLFAYASDMIDSGAAHFGSFKRDAAERILPKLGFISYADSFLKKLPFDKNLSDLSRQERDDMTTVLLGAQEDLKDQADELEDLLGSEDGRNRFIYSVLNGDVSSKLFTIGPDVRISQEYIKEDRKYVVTSPLKTGDLNKIADIDKVRKSFAPEKPMEVIDKKARESRTPEGEAVEKLLLGVASEYFKDDAAAIETAPNAYEARMMEKQMLAKLIKANIVGSPGSPYEVKEGEDIYETMNRIADDVRNEKEIYVFRQGKFYPIEAESKRGEPKLSKTAAQMINREQRLQYIDILEQYRDVMSKNTLGDSKEFRDFQKAYNNTIDNLKLGGLGVFMDAGKVTRELRNAAEKYYFAKVDQSQNATRSSRFKVADVLRGLGETVERTPSDKLKYNIAAKAVKGYAALLKKAGKDERRTVPRIEEGGRDFRNAVKNLMNEERFAAYCEGKNLAQLEKLFAKSSAGLTKDLFVDAKQKPSFLSPRPQARQPQPQPRQDKVIEAPAKNEPVIGGKI